MLVYFLIVMGVFINFGIIIFILMLYWVFEMVMFWDIVFMVDLDVW